MKAGLSAVLRPGPLRISAPRAERLADRWRVSARVGGRAVWFQSGLALEPSPEAFLSAFLLPAMGSGRDLISDAPVCPHWLDNVQCVRSLAARWWGFRGGGIQADVREPGPGAGEAGWETGLFFTGGVDSFHCLLSGMRSVDRLVYVAGYDVPLGDEDRIRSIAETVRAVAQSRGIDHVMLATNLRAHPAFRRIGWWKSHGGALAAAGHVLAGHLGRALAGGSVQLVPMGTHPELFPGWSSARLALEVQDAGTLRIAKLGRICWDPLVQDHLRVCWRNRGDHPNCGRCEKCLRTLIAIETAERGASTRFRTFPSGHPRDRLARLRRIPPSAMALWEEILASTQDPEIVRSVERLLAAARAREKRLSRLGGAALEIYREARARAGELRWPLSR